MAEPLYRLKHEHRIIERALRALNGMCIRIGWGDDIPSETLLEVLDFIKTFTDHYHHGKEETCLFPALERAGISGRYSAIDALNHQHEKERELTAIMIQSIENYRLEGAAWKERFIEAAMLYTEHLTEHMQQEEGLLFRIADEMLDEREKALLDEEFRQAASRLGSYAVEHYEIIATEMEKAWAV